MESGISHENDLDELLKELSRRLQCLRSICRYDRKNWHQVELLDVVLGCDAMRMASIIEILKNKLNIHFSKQLTFSNYLRYQMSFHSQLHCSSVVYVVAFRCYEERDEILKPICDRQTDKETDRWTYRQ